MSIPKFKRVVHMGMHGPDCRAIKIGLDQSGHGKGLGRNRTFGKNARDQLKHFQHSVGLPEDGVYGKKTHEKLAPHFTPFARWLYKRTKVVKHTDLTKLSARQAALQLEHCYSTGQYHPDRIEDLWDIRATAEGRKVRNALGYWVSIDRRVLQALLVLIHKGYKIGTFAICSDHHYDGMKGHAGGHSVDISSINGISVSSGSAEHVTASCAKAIHSAMPSGLHPWQEICNGCGYQYVSEISAQTIPGYWFYGSTVMHEHENHIHLGYYPTFTARVKHALRLG